MSGCIGFRSRKGADAAGAALYLYGVSGPEMGAGEIQLDGRSVASVNASVGHRVPNGRSGCWA